jgi:hypothetical protein
VAQDSETCVVNATAIGLVTKQRANICFARPCGCCCPQCSGGNTPSHRLAGWFDRQSCFMARSVWFEGCLLVRVPCGVLCIRQPGMQCRHWEGMPSVYAAPCTLLWSARQLWSGQTPHTSAIPAPKCNDDANTCNSLCSILQEPTGTQTPLQGTRGPAGSETI